MSHRALFVGQRVLPLQRALRSEVVDLGSSWSVRVPCSCGTWLESLADHEHGAHRERRRLAARRCPHAGANLDADNSTPSKAVGVGTEHERPAWVMACPLDGCEHLVAGATSSTFDGWHLTTFRMQRHLVRDHDLSIEMVDVALFRADFLREDQLDDPDTQPAANLCRRVRRLRLSALIGQALAEGAPGPARRVRHAQLRQCAASRNKGGRCSFRAEPGSDLCGRHLRAGA